MPRSPMSALPAIGVMTVLLALAITTAVALWSINEFERRAGWIGHTDIVIAHISDVGSVLQDAQSAVRGYIITGDERFLAPYTAARSTIVTRIDGLRKLVADNPSAVQAVGQLESQARDSLSIDDSMVQLRRSGSAAAAMGLVASGEGESVMWRIRLRIEQMIDAERHLLGQRESSAAASALHARVLIVLGALTGAAVFIAVFMLLRNENRRRREVDGALTAANDALQQRAQELEASNRELESFSYSISHDLRIPLRAVSGYALMLEEDYADKFDAEGRRLLGLIRDNSKRMGALIDDLLAFSRLGRQAMSAELVDMRLLVDSVIAQVKRGDDFANTQLQIGVLPAAWGDRALLQQVWINLLSNALKYSSGATEPVVRISGHETGLETIYVVADNGVGFDMQYYAKLFGVFQRLHSAETFPGTGVGLAIAHRIISRHRGRIWAEASVDGGATFFFALPREETALQ
ncbi:MAG: CHASE3 domain-containing protein [Pseudomonadota bacterium]|nr:CHASE3 domain-containing protein [Pseudomonadota bacterium]